MTNKFLDKVYDPKKTERYWYDFWEKKGFFRASMKPGRKSFSVVIPPPNVTGSLHIGHALNNTLQDIMVRYKRMQGYNTLWVFGTDHAGIATQNVVERQLAAEGISRQQIGRDAFVERVWRWRSRSGSTITRQLKLLGASCDWERERFTMDEGLSRAVRRVFVRLYREGLIYRDNYIINWCPRCHTALSDLEVEYEERPGQLYYIRYPLITAEEQGRQYLVVATTRPETMLGDTALAVNPEDERYGRFVGGKAMLPLVERELPVIGDGYVDPAFGTGCLKVTPAHDPNDFELGLKYGLEQIKVMDPEAVMNEAAGPYRGLTREECRKKLVEDLRRDGFLEKTEGYRHSVGHCYRCKTVVEPTVSRQWFMKMHGLAQPAIEAVRSKRVELIPSHWEATYFDWMLNIRDWCISRQIWWGHRIPAWYCGECGRISVSEEDISACQFCRSTRLEAEQDVLDTWFSSALWPFSTLGWPEETQELRFFYPTSLLTTSFDILFFWVARMIMIGLKFREQVPFRKVYIHALVRDAEGKKMSKSKGNVVDPLIKMEEYGTDAFRFTLAALTSQGRDICLDEKRIEGYRNFINKIWNAARFALMNLSGFEYKELPPGKADLDLAERWILSLLQKLIGDADKALEEYRFNDYANALYRFFWHEFCDWYLELAKLNLSNGEAAPEKRYASQWTLAVVLERVLKLLHPVIPFVSEEIWQKLPAAKNRGPSIMVSSWPVAEECFRDPRAEGEMDLVKDIIGAARNLRSEINLSPGQKTPTVIISVKGKQALAVLEKQVSALEFLCKTDALRLGVNLEKPAGSVSNVSINGEIIIPLAGVIDLDQEVKRLRKALHQHSSDLAVVEGKLQNSAFLQKAPERIVAKERAKFKELNGKVEKLQSNLARLQGHVERK